MHKKAKIELSVKITATFTFLTIELFKLMFYSLKF